MGARRSLHELELASGARMVVVMDFDILRTSDGPSRGTAASTSGAGARGIAEESKPDALEPAARIDSLADASARERSALGPPRALHAVIPTISAESAWHGERRTGSD
jgi:hypothetical protein